MKNIYGSGTISLMLVALIVVGITALNVAAQQNGNVALPDERSGVTEIHRETVKTPVFKQQFTDENYNLIHGKIVKGGNRPAFSQKYSTERVPLTTTANNKSKMAAPPAAASSLTSENSGALPVNNIINKSARAIMALESPVGTPDRFVVPTDNVLSVSAPGFLMNDIDLDGEPLTATLITDSPDNGQLSAFPDGSFSYTPDAGFTGTDQFSYQMRDASFNQSEPVTVTIEVLPAANRNPVGTPDSYAMAGGTILSVGSPGFLQNDIDPDGETITATLIVSTPANGTLTAFPNGSFTYTPDAGFAGTDQFAYRMRDASFNQSEAVTVTIEVFAANRGPIGVNDHYAAIVNTPLVIAAPGFLNNDVDPDGETVTATLIADSPDNGSLTAFPNGSFTYTPDPGFTGTDQFTYRMRDASFNTSEAVIVTIVVSPAGTTPVGSPDQYVVPADQVLTMASPGFLINDIDLDGEPLTATLIADSPDNGSLTAFPSGSFTYTPDAGFTGTDQFSYQMRDASFNQSEPVTVTIEVLPAANRNPVGTPDSYAMTAGTILSVVSPGFLHNDIDLDGETITATLISDAPDNGTLAAFPSGSFTYTPDEGFTGTDQFSYRMRDASFNQSEPVTVTIEVYEANRTPIGVDDQYAVLMNTPLVIAAPGFLLNDIDLDGESITAALIADAPENGSLTAFPSGSFTYTPDAGFTGTDQFSYQMRDASFNQSEPVTVTLQVYSTNQNPVADAGEDQSIECDGSEFYTVILDGSNSIDPENGPLLYTWRLNGNILSGPTADATSEVQLPPGIHDIELTVEDSFGESDTDVVTIKTEDTTPPSFTVPEDITIVKTEDCTFDAGTSFTGEVTDVSDNCDTDPEVDYTDASEAGECTGEEIITRTWTLTDASGNTASGIQIITVEDKTAPVITVPEDKVICMEAFPELLTTTWTDNCSSGGELTATGEWYSETECTTTWSYTFYIADDCGNEATETAYVTRQTEVYANCETAYAYSEETSICFLNDGFNNWGWTNYLEPSETSYILDLHAASGQCNINNGYQAGTVEVSYNNNEVTVTYELSEGYVLNDAHIYIGCNKYPVNGKKETVAPGKYTYNAGKLEKINNLSVTFTDVDGGIYLIAHASVCEILCECNTTEYSSVSGEMNLGINCNPTQSGEDLASGNKGKGKKSAALIEMDFAGLNIYPNPFSDKLNFEFTTKEDADATLVIYNLLGQKIETVLDRKVRKDELNTASFSPEKQVAGVYIYHLKLNGRVQTGKVVYNPEK